MFLKGLWINRNARFNQNWICRLYTNHHPIRILIGEAVSSWVQCPTFSSFASMTNIHCSIPLCQPVARIMCNVLLYTYCANRNFCAISVLYLLDPAYHHLATNPSKHRDMTCTVYFPPKTNTHRKNPVKPNILFQPIFLGFGGFILWGCNLPRVSTLLAKWHRHLHRRHKCTTIRHWPKLHTAALDVADGWR